MCRFDASENNYGEKITVNTKQTANEFIQSLDKSVSKNKITFLVCWLILIVILVFVFYRLENHWLDDDL